ncbi:MAG TPA: transcriptional repressor LexA [Firmicutes bacterium]|nr:transcriptional repressor LexA [Bacillota bacterium]
MGRRPSRDISPKQSKILGFIQARIAQNGYPPSLREIAQACGLRSASTVHGHLLRLERKGYIRRDPTKSRAIEIIQASPDSPGLLNARDDDIIDVAVTAPVVGRIAAGYPLLAVENIDEVLPIPKEFATDGPVFALRVQGDSMIGAGILNGDYVIVRQQNFAQNGDIVVALLGDEATVKRIYIENDFVRLQPENPNIAPIIARDVTVLGKVIGLLRKIR